MRRRDCAILGLVTWLLASVAFCQQPTSNPMVRVLTRGPIHEAYATPTTATSPHTPVVSKGPPEPLREQPPEYASPGSQVTWIPGYWAFDDHRNDFLWVSGIWRKVPPDQRWMPGYWIKHERGSRWIPGAWIDATQRAKYLPPPPDNQVENDIPPQPSREHFYVPGAWHHDGHRYQWKPGFWSQHREGWVWIPARYTPAANGYLYNDGYWDFEFVERGRLFAPVEVSNPVPTDFCFTPSTILSPSLLLHLFVDSARGIYVFGDYYDDQSVQPWLASGRSAAESDPLLSYYHWTHGARFPDALRRWHAYFTAHQPARPQRSQTEQLVFAERNPRFKYLRQISLAHPLVTVLKPSADAPEETYFTSLSSGLPMERMSIEQKLLHRSLPTSTSLWRLPEVGRGNGPEHPIVVRISEQWLQTQFGQRIDRTDEVNRIVLQTHARGTSRTTADVHVDLLPSDHSGQFKISLVGRTVARTLGRNGPVLIDTTTWTDFHSVKQVFLDGQQGFHAEPARIHSQTGSRTNSVRTNFRGVIGRIIRNSAWQQINALSGQANAIAQRDIEQDVVTSFDDAIRTQLAQLDGSLDVPSLLPDELVDLTNGRVHVCSTDSHLLICIGGHRAAVPQFADTGLTPPLQLWVDESLVDEQLAAGIGMLKAADSFLSVFNVSKSLATKAAVAGWLGDTAVPFEGLERRDGWLIVDLDSSDVADAFANK